MGIREEESKEVAVGLCFAHQSQCRTMEKAGLESGRPCFESFLNFSPVGTLGALFLTSEVGELTLMRAE
jgi:hypothetical protein